MSVVQKEDQKEVYGYKHAALYAKFRPSPPDSLVKRIVQFLQVKRNGPYKLAVDAGCGSGQSTVGLAPHFEKVVGTDVSAAQIKEAQESGDAPGNVSYACCSGYEQPVGNESTELVTVCQAAHWLDMTKFNAETDRILVPNGVQAIIGYSFPRLTLLGAKNSKSDVLSNLLINMYKIDTNKYWSPKRALVDNCYQDVPPAYPTTAERFDTTFTVKFNADVDQIVGYVSTWSGFQGLCESEGDSRGKEVLHKFEQKLMDEAGITTKTKEHVFEVCFNYFMILCRKPSPGKN